MKIQAPTQAHAREFSRLIDRYLDLERLREEVRNAELANTWAGQKSLIAAGRPQEKNAHSAA